MAAMAFGDGVGDSETRNRIDRLRDAIDYVALRLFSYYSSMSDPQFALSIIFQNVEIFIP